MYGYLVNFPIKKKTLIIVHKEFLLNQWKERLEQFMPDAKIGRIQGPIIDIEGKDVVIGMLQSLSMKHYEQTMFLDFGFTILDECFPYNQYIHTDLGPIQLEHYMKNGKMVKHCQ